MTGPTKPVVLTLVGNYLPGYKAGGLVRTIVNTVEHLCDEFEFRIVTRDRDVGDTEPYEGIKRDQWQQVGNALVYYLSPASQTGRHIREVIAGTWHSALWLNSFFDPLTNFALLNLRLGRVSSSAVIVAPRGEFAWASLQQKYPKKLIFTYMARFGRLHRDISWHASSEGEARDIADVMKIDRRDIYVIDDFPIKSTGGSPGPGERPPVVTGAALRIVFLSRIAREKKLDYALKLLVQVRAHVLFDIYGPVHDTTYWNECQELIRKLPSNVTVNYLGSVRPDEVVDVFTRYDLFFFPTGGEAYGHVIAESLSAGTPVLLSTETSWRNLQVEGLGWDLDLAHERAFVEVIENLAALGTEERIRNRIEVKARITKRLFDPTIMEAHRRLFLGQGRRARFAPVVSSRR